MPTGFHEILIHDMGLEEWPKVPLSEIGCLRLDWPKELFNFVGRYQLELEQMRKECRDRFEGISSGACPTCEKFIQVNLGRHVALYHLDLAQLWRCPVDWCPVWKGTSQDCIDHMRRAHNTVSSSLVRPVTEPTDDPVVPPTGGTRDWPALRPANFETTVR